MTLEEVIKNRRSIRKFSDKKVDKEIIEKIIEAGMHAPSHCDTQGWKFIVIDDENVKNKIFEAGGSFVIKNAPYGILTLYNTALSDNLEYRDWIIDGAVAVENILLTIHDLGLGGCCICHLPRKKNLKKILNIQEPYTPITYIVFGYPQVPPATVPRKYQLNEIYSVNKFIWPKTNIPSKVRLRRFFRKIYFYLPTFLKKLIYPIVDKFVKKFSN